MTRVLSIDPGVRHLTWVEMTIPTEGMIRLHRWEIIDLLSPDLAIPRCDDYIYTTCSLWTKKQLESFFSSVSSVEENPFKDTKKRLVKNDYLSWIKTKYKCEQKEVNIHILARRLIDFLSITSFDEIDKVIIENQPTPKNPRMKSIQTILMTYFMMKYPRVTIHFIPASLKMSFCLKMKYIDKKPKGYSETKKTSISVLENHILPKLPCDEIKQQWNAAKKKDDLSDVILQGLAFSKKYV
jgi:hypothetical protein